MKIKSVIVSNDAVPNYFAPRNTKKEAWVKQTKICVHCQIAKSICAVSWDTKFANNLIFSW